MQSQARKRLSGCLVKVPQNVSPRHQRNHKINTKMLRNDIRTKIAKSWKSYVFRRKNIHFQGSGRYGNRRKPSESVPRTTQILLWHFNARPLQKIRKINKFRQKMSKNWGHGSGTSENAARDRFLLDVGRFWLPNGVPKSTEIWKKATKKNVKTRLLQPSRTSAQLSAKEAGVKPSGVCIYPDKY